MTAPDQTLHCPWCGPMNGHYGYTVTRFGTRLTCFCCDSHGPRAPTQDEAKAAWNTRAPLAEVLAVPEVAREALMVERIDDVAEICRQFRLSEPRFRAALLALIAKGATNNDE